MSKSSVKILLGIIIGAIACALCTGFSLIIGGVIFTAKSYSDTAFILKDEDLRWKMFTGTISTDMQAELYFTPYCYPRDSYIKDTKCWEFMQQTLPYLLRDGQNRFWYGVQIYPHDIYSSAVEPMMADFGMTCAAEQDKMTPYLLSYVQWMDKAEFINKNSPVYLTDFEQQKLREIGINIEQWVKCIDKESYREYILASISKVSHDQAMVLRFSNDKSTEFIYPTIDEVKAALEKGKTYYDNLYNYDPSWNYKKH